MTGITIGTAGGNKSLNAAYVGTASGNKAILNVYVGTAGGNKLVWTAMSAAPSPASVAGGRPTAGAAVSSSTTIVVTGGSGSYLYQWHVTTTTGNTISASSPTSGTTTFTGIVNSTVPQDSGHAYCTVTDMGTGATVDSSNVSISLSYTGP